MCSLRGFSANVLMTSQKDMVKLIHDFNIHNQFFENIFVANHLQAVEVWAVPTKSGHKSVLAFTFRLYHCLFQFISFFPRCGFFFHLTIRIYNKWSVDLMLPYLDSFFPLRLEVVTNKNKVVAYEAIEKEKLIVKCSEPTKGNCLRKSKSLSLPPAMIQLMRWWI